MFILPWRGLCHLPGESNFQPLETASHKMLQLVPKQRGRLLHNRRVAHLASHVAQHHANCDLYFANRVAF